MDLDLFGVVFMNSPQEEIVETVLHEVGHLWVAAKSRRNKLDYGCPPNAEESSHWELEEAKAILVEHELKKLLGIKTHKDPYDNRAINGDEQAKALNWWSEKGRKRTATLWQRAQQHPLNRIPMSLEG